MISIKRFQINWRIILKSKRVIFNYLHMILMLLIYLMSHNLQRDIK